MRIREKLLSLLTFLICCPPRSYAFMRPIHQSVTTTQRIRLVSVNINNERSPPPLVLQKGPPLKSVSPSIIQSSTYFHSRSSTRLYNHHHEVIINGPLDLLLSTPEFWSAAIMLTIVGLLLAWEESVLTLREKLPTALLSVVDSMLAEMGGLGFIGLFLAVVVTDGPLGDIIGELSERFLGEEEILLETFEFLHQAFFEVGIGFFTIAGVTVYAVLKEIQKLSEISELALDTDGDGEVSLEELADALDVQSLIVDADGDGEITEEEVTDALRRSQKGGIFDEISMTPEEMCSEALVIRERLILERGLPDSFMIEKYFEQIFAHNLEEIVELSPVTWLPLIPLIALCTSVDLNHDVVSAASANAFETCGEFISTPWVFYPTIALQVVGMTWGLYNFWKMAAIKGMLMPTLVRDGSDDGPAVLLPPRVEDEKIRLDFQSTPTFASGIEEALGKPGTNRHERLFGAAGSNGPQLFLKSIKFHTWLCVTQIVFYGSQIVLRDIAAFIDINDGKMIQVGNVNALFPETMVFGLFVLLSIGQLALAPRTFLNYCFATSIEGMTKDWAMKIAMEESEKIFQKEQTEVAEAALIVDSSPNGDASVESTSSPISVELSASSPTSLNEPVQSNTDLVLQSNGAKDLNIASSLLNKATENTDFQLHGHTYARAEEHALKSDEMVATTYPAQEFDTYGKELQVLEADTSDTFEIDVASGDTSSSNGTELEEVFVKTITTLHEKQTTRDLVATRDMSPQEYFRRTSGFGF